MVSFLGPVDRVPDQVESMPCDIRKGTESEGNGGIQGFKVYRFPVP